MISFPEANKLIAVSDLGILVVTELSTGEEMQTLNPVYPYRQPLKLLINPPGRNIILAADSQGRIFIWTHEPTVELVV